MFIPPNASPATVASVVNGQLDNDNLRAVPAIAISKTALGTFTPWTDWTPTFTAAAGTPTTVTINLARYMQLGKMVWVSCDFTVTNKGTASSDFYYTLPVTASTTTACGGGGREQVVVGYNISTFLIDTTHGGLCYYDNTTVWNNTHRLVFGMFYEVP